MWVFGNAIYTSLDFYVFYQCKHIGILTCTQHLLIRSVRRPDDGCLKKSKLVASYTIK